MGINFRDVFKEQSTEILPDPIIKSLTNELQLRTNTSLVYTSGPNGEALLKDPNDNLALNFSIKLPKKAKELKINNVNDFTRYLYNTQTTVNINSESFNIKGVPFKISDFIVLPFETKTKEKEIISFIVPQPFDPPHKLNFRFGKSKVEFMVQQVVHPSVEEVKFKSKNIPALVLSLTYNLVKETLNMNINFDSQKANSVSEVVYYAEIMDNFYKNNVFFNGKKFALNASIKKNSSHNSTINFFQKLKKIEEYFSIAFDNKISFDESDIIEVEKLYLSLIENKAFKNNNEKRVNQLFLEPNIPEDELQLIDKLIKDQDYLRLFTHNLVTITMLGAKFNVKKIILNQGIKYTNYQHTNENIIVDTQYSDDGFDSELYINADIEIDENALVTLTPILEKPIELKKALKDSYGKTSSK